jgi:hypothetical protein
MRTKKSLAGALRPFSPAGEGQDEAVLTRSICSEAEPPHPSSPLWGEGVARNARGVLAPTSYRAV